MNTSKPNFKYASTQSAYKQTEIGMIPEEWEVKKIGDCIELSYGKGLPERDRKKGNIPVFGSNGIVGCHNEALVKGPGIIIGRKGSVGEITFSKQDFWPIDTTYFVKTKENNDIVFWYYFLKTLNLNLMNVHSAVPGLNRENVYEIKKHLPPLPEQRAIAKILSDLDAKIELNREMNKTLEEIGRAIFKRWFVDFEFPNEEGKPYKSSGGPMEYNEELGKEMPKGWRVGRLKDIVNINAGFGFKSESFDKSGLYKLVTIKNVQDGYFVPECDDRISKIPTEMPKFCFLTTGDIILSLTGNVGRVCFISGENYLLNQRLAKLTPVNQHDTAFVYFLFRQTSLKNTLINISKGTAQQNLSPIETKELSIVIPTRKILDTFGNFSNKIFNRMLKNEINIRTLVEIREALLPKLMSGKIRVLVSTDSSVHEVHAE